MTNTNLKQRLSIALFIFFCLIFIPSNAHAANSSYGAGAYGQCAYGEEGGTCAISISDNGFTLILNVTPISTGNCTIQSDTVTVTTSDPNGYTLTLADQSTNTNLVNGSNNIPTTSGTDASPLTLSDNWGYRVDGLTSAMGTGPTGAVTNGGTSSLKFAGIQPSSGTPDTIGSSSSYSSSGVQTLVWYGICLDYGLAVPAGSYTTTVLYTATAN